MPDLFTASTATLSPCGRYRYALGRAWDAALPVLGWLMLNPSTADAAVDDPTVRRCCGFARDAGCGGIAVANLFAFRASDPGELARVADPVGPGADRAVLDLFDRCDRVVAAWGVLGRYLGRDAHVLDLVGQAGHLPRLYRLGPTTAGGQPRHPLYLAADTPLVPFAVAEGGAA